MTRITLALGALMIVAAASARADEAVTGDPVPGAGLGPDAVVRIQLEALRDNDAADAGIATAFRFASPGNRASTGPVARFARMIKEGPYRLMLDYRVARFDPVEVAGDRARQRVTLLGDAETITYEFRLSRQRAPECPTACWMTDAVFLVPFDGRSA